jgi:hypothetical protein
MRTFHCSHCQNLVFFENVKCLNCGHELAFLPEQMQIAALEPGAPGQWRYDDHDYKLCANNTDHQICNWALPLADPEALCHSCRLTRIIPDLSLPGSTQAWHKLEIAKRRLLYTLLAVGLRLSAKTAADPTGVEFEFLKDSAEPQGDRGRVLTGHDNGVITINIAEADDVYREQERARQNEPYRTLLGHFRHEVGHYYWDRLILDGPRQSGFRQLFGDERDNYQAALDRHYQNGPPPQWENDFISAYATTHPWEDWAESWAHVLHMIDALETAESVGVSIQPRRTDEPVLVFAKTMSKAGGAAFDDMIAAWLPLTYALNNFARGLGLQDGYPFVLSQHVINKLRFVYETIMENRASR